MAEPETSRLDALAAGQERTDRNVAKLNQMLHGLATQLTRVAEGLQRGDDEAPSVVTSWLLADDPMLAHAELVGLCEWLTAVYLRYPDAALPSCWLWHPAAVEELLWLRGAHAAAYTGPEATWTRVADWHDRQRPGVIRRLAPLAKRCELSLHQPGQAEHRPSPTTPLAYATDEITTAWTLDRQQPTPTPTHLADADQHQSDQNRRTRA